MMYFTIPENVLGAGQPASDTDVYLDNGVNIGSKPNLNVVKFGDGYSSSVPLGPRERTFNGDFSNREADLIDLIDRYFTYLEGEPINNFHILGVAATVITLKWGKNYRHQEISGLTAEFQEEHR